MIVMPEDTDGYVRTFGRWLTSPRPVPPWREVLLWSAIVLCLLLNGADSVQFHYSAAWGMP